MGGLSGCGAEDAVLLSVVAAQVGDDGFEYADVVVDGEDNGFWHGDDYRGKAWLFGDSLRIR